MRRFMIPVGVWCTLIGTNQAHVDDPIPLFECRYAESPITIDGKADEEAWKHAQIIDQFSLPWLGDKARPARTATKARLLWDREYLYFFAEMEDTDLYADITEHDGETWHNDVFELFFKPDTDKPGYYEFEINAAGAVMDAFFPRRGAGGLRRFMKADKFHVEVKVVLRGTLNKWQDKDEGWSVEGRIPWRDFARTGGRPAVDEEWRFALCRYDYSVDFEGPELSTCAPLKSKKFPDFHHHEDYARLQFLGPSQLKDMRGALDQVPSRVVGSPEPPPPYRTERVFPELAISWPIFATREPGSTRLWFIDQKWSYGPARLCRTSDDPAAGKFDTLLEFPDGGVAYDLAFHPDYARNGYVFIGWNGKHPDEKHKHTWISRYTATREPSFSLDPDSRLDVIHWPSDGHNGGALAFGLDGMLYVTSGDGTSDSDTDVTGQGLDHLLAKVLRIDVDRPSQDRPYSIPKDNPFVDRKGARPETWAYGLRNPWRITVDAKTGHIWVGNNGQDLWEQAYLIGKGENYGWSVYEGSHPFYPKRELGPTPHVKPTLEHPHSEARSLTGGIVYHGDRYPDLRGAYIYGDYSTGKIWAAKVEDRQVTWHREIADTTLQITSFLTTPDGDILITDHQGKEQGGLQRLVPNENTSRNVDFPQTLSESGLFSSVKDHQLHPGAIPYSVNSPLWSDGAFKSRSMVLPSDDLKIGFHRRESWDFPDRTVLVKSFALEMTEGDPDSRRWIETRFFTKQEGEWAGYSYRWDHDQKEARLVDKEGADTIFKIRTADGREREQDWRYPSRTECMTCHSRAARFVLGLSTAQLNREHDYDGLRMNQLEAFEALGVLRIDGPGEMKQALKDHLADMGVPEDQREKVVRDQLATRDQRTIPEASLLFRTPQGYDRLVNPYDDSANLTERVRSYLHANCAQCHVMAGGGNAQIDLKYTTDIDKMNLLDVKPIHDTFGIPEARLVAPGDPDRSVLLRRIAIRDRGQMPQLATSCVDHEAAQLVRRWIESLPPAKPLGE